MSAPTATLEQHTCPNCGATTSFDPALRTVRCPFCGTDFGVSGTAAAVPTLVNVDQFVLPFRLTAEASAESIRAWLGSSFFAPRDLKSRSTIRQGTGTYVPFWRFDAEADSDWEGEVSRTNTRQVQRVVTNADGKSETRWVDEQYLTWHPRSGSHRGSHRTYVTASTGLTQQEADQLMPFPEEGMRTFTADLLAGFAAEQPGVDEDGAWETGERRIREMERDECAQEVERLTRVETQLSNRRTALCYLPVWVYTYAYQGKQFHVSVNGDTGEIIGDRPVSRGRVAMVVAAVAVVVILIIIAIVVLQSG